MATKKKLKNKVKYLKEENEGLKETINPLTESLKTTQKDLSTETDKQVYESLDPESIVSTMKKLFSEIVGETRDPKEAKKRINSQPTQVDSAEMIERSMEQALSFAMHGKAGLDLDTETGGLNLDGVFGRTMGTAPLTSKLSIEKEMLKELKYYPFGTHGQYREYFDPEVQVLLYFLTKQNDLMPPLKTSLESMRTCSIKHKAVMQAFNNIREIANHSKERYDFSYSEIMGLSQAMVLGTELVLHDPTGEFEKFAKSLYPKVLVKRTQTK